jgi:hypothetical protein
MSIPFFSTFLSTLVIIYVFDCSYPSGMKCYFILVLIYITLMAYVEHLVMGYGPSVYFLWERFAKDLCLF